MQETATIERPKLKRGRNYVHKIGPHSRPHHLVKIDGRTNHAFLMRKVRQELTEYVGGNPSAIQKALIERVVWLTLKLSMFDEKLASGNFTENDSHTYLAWSNSCCRTLTRLHQMSPRRGKSAGQQIMAEVAG